MGLALGEWAELVAHEDEMPFCLLAAASQQVTVPWASTRVWLRLGVQAVSPHHLPLCRAVHLQGALWG